MRLFPWGSYTQVVVEGDLDRFVRQNAGAIQKKLAEMANEKERGRQRNRYMDGHT